MRITSVLDFESNCHMYLNKTVHTGQMHVHHRVLNDWHNDINDFPSLSVNFLKLLSLLHFWLDYSEYFTIGSRPLVASCNEAGISTFWAGWSKLSTLRSGVLWPTGQLGPDRFMNIYIKYTESKGDMEPWMTALYWEFIAKCFKLYPRCVFGMVNCSNEI